MKSMLMPVLAIRVVVEATITTERLAEQLAVVAKAFKNRVPSLAKESIAGVRATGSP